MAVILKKENAKTKNKNKKQTEKKKKTVLWQPTSFFFLRVHKLLFYFYCGMNDNIKPKTRKYTTYITLCVMNKI